jgi:hypothetical protein
VLETNGLQAFGEPGTDRQRQLIVVAFDTKPSQWSEGAECCAAAEISPQTLNVKRGVF